MPLFVTSHLTSSSIMLSIYYLCVWNEVFITHHKYYIFPKIYLFGKKLSKMSHSHKWESMDPPPPRRRKQQHDSFIAQQVSSVGRTKNFLR